ncbi:HNH endonuclease signature motif containing protein [Serratia grimesii]|uniref:HNH endonuclease signature motif containing protein n=1 Tax=Serratia grimesii TaxID=82995 RepID=UPI00077C5EDF|nr:HNH endonuclease signature motif containing protein [Serratia grimesii]
MHKWNEFFEYRNGCLFWKISRRGPVKAGDEVRNIDGKGYIRVMVNRKFYLAHRIIYELHNGPIPDGMQIDHLDGNRTNNAIENLRVSSSSTNQRNKSKQSNNTSGVTGVCFDKSSCKWLARICHTNLGKFESFDEACKARQEAIKSNPSFTLRHGK